MERLVNHHKNDKQGSQKIPFSYTFILHCIAGVLSCIIDYVRNNPTQLSPWVVQPGDELVVVSAASLAGDAICSVALACSIETQFSFHHSVVYDWAGICVV